MKYRLGSVLALTAALLVGLPCAVAWANVYASGLTLTGPSSISYILNDTADAGVVVQVWQVGGGMVYSESLGSQAKGVHTWSWNGSGYTPGNTYKIRIVASSAGYSDWTRISTDQTSTSFYLPLGVAVNKMQSSPNFGKIYISNAQAGTTAYGRACQDGIYILNADASEAGFATGGKDWVAAGNSSPFKSTIGPDGHLYVVDYNNDLLWEFNEDLSAVTQLIDSSNKTANQYVAAVHVEGTQAAGNRRLYLVNSNYYDTARKGMIMYKLDGNATATPGDTGIQYIGPTYFTYYPMDVARDSAGDWYMCQFRWNPAEAPALSKFADVPEDELPINSAVWETPKTSPYNGGYGIDIYEPYGWIAYGNFYDGWVRIFNMYDGSYVGGFDAGSRLRDIAFDAAGNIVTIDNITEWVRIWSPAGANSFTTESWFAIPEPSCVAALAFGLPLLVVRRRK
ncbi:MAG: hypothetical protein ACUVRS_08975 [Armatimonadota bacterium]